jgi:hypothetical protein
MTGFNIIMVIAIILFARLGVRLFFKWKELKNDSVSQENKPEQEVRSTKNDSLKK